MSFLVTEGYGPEGMTDDSIGVDFGVTNELTLNLNVTEEDTDIDIEIDEDDIEVSIDTIFIEIDVGE